MELGRAVHGAAERLGEAVRVRHGRLCPGATGGGAVEGLGAAGGGGAAHRATTGGGPVGSRGLEREIAFKAV